MFGLVWLAQQFLKISLTENLFLSHGGPHTSGAEEDHAGRGAALEVKTVFPEWQGFSLNLILQAFNKGMAVFHQEGYY